MSDKSGHEEWLDLFSLWPSKVPFPGRWFCLPAGMKLNAIELVDSNQFWKILRQQTLSWVRSCVWDSYLYYKNWVRQTELVPSLRNIIIPVTAIYTNPFKSAKLISVPSFNWHSHKLRSLSIADHSMSHHFNWSQDGKFWFIIIWPHVFITISGGELQSRSSRLHSVNNPNYRV